MKEMLKDVLMEYVIDPLVTFILIALLVILALCLYFGYQRSAEQRQHRQNVAQSVFINAINFQRCSLGKSVPGRNYGKTKNGPPRKNTQKCLDAAYSLEADLMTASDARSAL